MRNQSCRWRTQTSHMPIEIWLSRSRSDLGGHLLESSHTAAAVARLHRVAPPSAAWSSTMVNATTSASSRPTIALTAAPQAAQINPGKRFEAWAAEHRLPVVTTTCNFRMFAWNMNDRTAAWTARTSKSPRPTTAAARWRPSVLRFHHARQRIRPAGRLQGPSRRLSLRPTSGPESIELTKPLTAESSE